MNRPLLRSLVALAGLVLLAGCQTPAARLQSPDAEEATDQTKLVGDLTVPFGTNTIQVDGIALVTGLDGTGGDPPPSLERDVLVGDMLARDVENPSMVLKDPSTALVKVRGYLRPGIQKGEHFDLEVRTTSRSSTDSLRGGWMMRTRLKEMGFYGGRLREGKPLALAEGPILIDPSAGKKSKVSLVRGRILGGGVALDSRSLGLVLKPSHQSFTKSARVGDVINQRFHTYENGIQRGVAKPKTNEFIELTVHPRYKDNISRYIAVVSSIGVLETISGREGRRATLERQLLDPVTAPTAALRLEAVGEEAVPTLVRGLHADDASVRFFAAEALAYLNEPKAAEPLGEAAREHPEFRVYALAALSAMDDGRARQELRNLLDAPSAETRYGAFRARWAMNDTDPVVQGEMLGGQFSYHLLATSGDPMVHVTRNKRSEVVLFGHEQRFQPPFALDAGPKIMVTAGEGEDSVRVTAFASGDAAEVESRNVSTKIDDVIRTVVQLGATYPDVVQMLQAADDAGALPGRFAVDALPEANRTYRPEGDSSQRAEAGTSSPLPNLFDKISTSSDDESEPDDEPEEQDDESKDEPEEQPGFLKRLFGRMMGRSADS